MTYAGGSQGLESFLRPAQERGLRQNLFATFAVAVLTELEQIRMSATGIGPHNAEDFKDRTDPLIDWDLGNVSQDRPSLPSGSDSKRLPAAIVPDKKRGLVAAKARAPRSGRENDLRHNGRRFGRFVRRRD